MNVLVTGGAGYIGSHLVDCLIAEGHHVIVLDNLLTGKIDNISHQLNHPQFSFIHDTILNTSILEPLIAEVQYIYHLAAVVGVKYVIDYPLQGIMTNVRGSENVLELAAKHQVKTLIASSSEVYGKSEKVPLGEDDDSVIGPTSIGRWCYALAKAIDEQLAFIYSQQGLPVTIVRYFNSYGPRLDPKGYGSVVAKFINQAIREEPITIYDDGQQTRCFTYITDTIRGTLLAAQKPEAEGKAFNIGSNYEISIYDLAVLVRDLAGSRSRIINLPYDRAYGSRFEETRRRVPDIQRAQRILNFSAEISLQDGLMRTIDWFKQNKPVTNNK